MKSIAATGYAVTDGQELLATLTHRYDVRVGHEVHPGVRAEYIVILNESQT